ncbi:MAG: tRNA (adenosine(37)-N6)-dimethylallyltransferase, partial [Bacteroidales bacterium]
DFGLAFAEITSKGKIPVLCGGTGLYIESILSGYQLLEVPNNEILRHELELLSDNELVIKLSSLRKLHNSTDILDRERMVRAIEIESYKKENITRKPDFDLQNSLVYGIRFDRKTVRSRITQRLVQRLEEGMIEEVQQLLDNGISAEKIKWYGLEYKYVTMFILGELNKNEMFNLLNTAIHQFAKRQTTWFRRMEKNGISINWLEGEDGLEVNLQKVLKQIGMLGSGMQ